MKTITELMNKIKDNLEIIKKEDQKKIISNLKNLSDQSEELGQSRLLIIIRQKARDFSHGMNALT